MMDTTEVVVGFDRSAPSLTALHWAAAEAGRRGVPLRVVLAYHWRFPGAERMAGEDFAETVHQQARTIVAEAVVRARKVTPGLDAHGSTVEGQAAAALLEAAGQAALTVVGHRGRGGFASLLLGSVGLQVATHADGPVVVVRGRADAANGPVLVGVDGSPQAAIAAGVAFEEAAARHCAVLAARAHPDLTAPWAIEPPAGHDAAAEADRLRTELTQQLAGLRSRYPQVPVEYQVRQGQAADVLTYLSLQAQLVVVGTRSHGGFAGLLLGSVAQQLLQHSDCPVLIARTRSGTSPRVG